MNILVIGNGFDLAHGLPTRYGDFLEWVKAEYELNIKLCERNMIDDFDRVNVDWAIIAFPSKIKVEEIKKENVQREIWGCISNNFWIDYFLNNLDHLGVDWIDFESEIKLMNYLTNFLIENFYIRDMSRYFMMQTEIGEESKK